MSYHFIVKRTMMLKDDHNRHQQLAKYIARVAQFPRMRLFFWLLLCSDSLNKYATKEVGDKGVSRTMLAVLQISIKYPNGISQQTIANETGRTKQAIALAIDNMVKKNYVTRCSDSNDRRINFIRITKEGLDFLSEVFPHTVAMCNKAFSTYSDSEINELIPVIKQLAKNLKQKTGSFSL